MSDVRDRTSDEFVRTTYRERAPSRHLHDHVVCFWHRPGDAPASSARILPDGCIDLIWIDDQPPFISGPMTVSVVPTPSTGEEIIGVRLRPGTAATLLGISARELLDQHVPLRDIWPRDRCQPWAEAAIGDDLSTRIETISAAMGSRLERVAPPDPFVSDAARWIAAHPSRGVEALTRLSGLSARQIRRRFDDAIGHGPKKLQRILRLQRLLWLASQEDVAGRNLADLSFAAGYADQPHMTREVVALAGVTPTRLLLGPDPASAVSVLFKTPPR